MLPKKRFLVLGILYTIVAVAFIGGLLFLGGTLTSDSEGLKPEDFIFLIVALFPIIIIAILSIAAAISAFAAYHGSRAGIIVLAICSTLGVLVSLTIPHIHAGGPLLLSDIIAIMRLATIPLHLSAAIISWIGAAHSKQDTASPQMQFQQSQIPAGLQNQQFPPPSIPYQSQYPSSVSNAWSEDGTRRF